MNRASLHTIVLLAAFACYTVLTAMHVDGNPVLQAAAGYGVGAAGERAMTNGTSR